jgi:ATP-binding cassette subfamily C protein LapB
VIHHDLQQALARLALMQGTRLDPLELTAVIEQAEERASQPLALATRVLRGLRLAAPRRLRRIDPSVMPLLAHSDGLGWCLIRGRTASGQWLLQHLDADTNQWVETRQASLEDCLILKVQLAAPVTFGGSRVFQSIRAEFTRNRGRMAEIVLATVLINLLVMASSFYSMQVYDRVIPNQAFNTLIVLTAGVILANVFELLIKLSRTHLLDAVSTEVDRTMVRRVFLRVLGVRLDQFPASVGSLAGELRGYESVRGFLSASTLFVMVDLPFAAVFVVMMGLLAGTLMAVIPLTCLLLSLLMSVRHHNSIEAMANRSTAASNRKTGLLVETIEAAETIKSSNAGWQLLSRWVSTNDEAREFELRMRRASENTHFYLGFAHQMAYVMQIAVGAWQVAQGDYTMGGLIACSILSGRALGPVSAMPSIMAQAAQARASLRGLERLWSLERDHAAGERPLVPERIEGRFELENLRISYPGTPVAFSVAHLTIQAGERVGIIGPVGSGKTTLLRALSGLYKPQEGRVLLDGLDMTQIARPVIAEHLAYLQQEGRLLSGTLRDNLIIGIPDPGDTAILTAASRTGLIGLIQAHPRGLSMTIAEGGGGLSGGQKQLVNLTRILLREPHIWLLDEPTSAMDRALETHCLNLFATTLTPEHTLVLVTHKPELLALVHRLVVVVNHQVVLDGEKNAVLTALNRAQQGDAQSAQISREAANG